MNRLLTLTLLSMCTACFGDPALDDYFALLQAYPQTLGPLGDASTGEIEIVLDEDKIHELELSCKRKIGVVARDNYYIWINDACKFPGGSYGIYGRMNWVKNVEGLSGVAVMPVLPDGRIVLNCMYRHATRSWEIEIPRGGRNPGETIYEVAKREVLEETGMEVDDLQLLGEMTPASGLTGAVAPIFMAKVVAKQKRHLDDTEAIAEIFALTLEEVKEALIRGYYEGWVLGEYCRVPVRDSHLAYAILLYQLKGYSRNL